MAKLRPSLLRNPFRSVPNLPTTTRRFWLSVQQRQQATMSLWEVSLEGINEIEALPAAASPVLALADEDLRIVTERSSSTQRARSLLRQQCGQPVRVINDSARGVIYGRPVAAVPPGCAVTPMSWLVDRILGRDGWPDHPFVVGLLLAAGESANEILALWAANARHELGDLQFTENAQSADQIIEAYCATHSIEPRAENIVLVDLPQLFAAIDAEFARLPTYPDADEWHGIPLNRLWQVSAGLSGAAALILSTILGVAFVRGLNMDRAQMEVAEAAATTRTELVDLLMNHLSEVAERGSIDHRHLAHLARELHLPGSSVSLGSADGRPTLRLTVPLETGTAGTERMTTRSEFVRVTAAARQIKLAGVSPRTSLSSGGNEINFDFAIKESDLRLLDYLAR